MSAWRGALPISVRVGLAGTVAFLGLLILVGAVVHTMLGSSLRASIDDQLVASADSLPDWLFDEDDDPDHGRPGSDPPDLDALSAELADDDAPADPDVQLIDRDNRVAAAVGDVTQDSPLLDTTALDRARLDDSGPSTVSDADGARYRVIAVPVEGSEAVAVIARPLAPVAQAQAALLRVYGPAAVVATLLAGGLGYLAARRGLAPLSRLTREASGLGDAPLTRRLPDAARRDEVGRLTRTLNLMLERVEAAVRREREFTADASHELRTPLAILRAEVELALYAVTDPTVRASLASALDEVDRLTALIDDLLVLARADSGQLDGRQVVDLGEVAGRFQAIALQRDVGLRVEGVAVVTGDAPSLERAVVNLVDNAVRHTPARGTVFVEVRPRTGTGAVLSVRDTGPGIPAARLEAAFERFSQVSGANGRGAAGLGLSIVAAVATAHGGEAEAVNADGGGLLVTLTLP